MKIILQILLFFCVSVTFAQTKVEMTSKGFTPIELSAPNKPVEKSIEAAKNWAATYNKNGYDVYDVTANSLKIDGLKKNAYFYRNLGETFTYNITYTLEVYFNADKTYTLAFSVKQIYLKNTPVQTTIADFYMPDGKLKEDFADVKPSLEDTAEKIVKSFSNFIIN